MQRLALFLLGIAIAAPLAAGPRDGMRFDPGLQMTTRAAGAPEELDRVVGFLGLWDVQIIRSVPDAEPLAYEGIAEITFINRGHALMESLDVPAVAGRPFSAIWFLGYNPASTRWFLAGADNVTERAWVADGGFQGPRLVFTETRRPGGGVTRTQVRYGLRQPSEDELEWVIESSTDLGATWSETERRTYRRRSAGEFPRSSTRYGTPDPERPAQAAEFDFLIGEWDDSHDLTFPNGQRVQWGADGTAVYALNGFALLEFSWFDTDPTLPDAATTILRLYNRAMRRWECLYVPNRGHSVLYFGGTRERDRIVLTLFETDTSAPSIPRFVFHSMKKNRYWWFSEASTDRGVSWTKTWLIEGRRKRVR